MKPGTEIGTLSEPGIGEDFFPRGLNENTSLTVVSHPHINSGLRLAQSAWRFNLAISAIKHFFLCAPLDIMLSEAEEFRTMLCAR
jgi:hypothetical protein